METKKPYSAGLMMHNILTNDTKAILLLCSIFGKNSSANSLSLKEYLSLVRWLMREGLRPGDLLHRENISEASAGTGLDKQRLESLLGRGEHLGIAVEEWQRNGVWIVSRSDSDYPVRYKKHLNDKAPPVLFGVGNRNLLNGGGLCIVGSRNVDQAGVVFSRQVSELCVGNGISVISGGARGVDRISMAAALDAGGVSIGILPENLLKKSAERSVRHAIADGRLLLLSPYHPTACFSVGAAIGRNKLIYALADFGLVVSAEYKKGGTWAGAEEALKRDFSPPVFVRVGKNVPSGNSKLLDLGAIPWPESIDRGGFPQQLYNVAAQARKRANEKNLSLFESTTQKLIH